MLKTALLLTCVLAAAARAQPAPPSVQTVRLSLTIKSGTDTRTHELVITDDSCGSIKEQRAGAYEDEVTICTNPTATGIKLHLEGKTRNGTTEYQQRSQVVIARRGGKVEVGRINGMRFALETL